MTKGDTARQLYHGEEKLNCAQAVLKAFQPERAVTDKQIAAAKGAGGGRAPGGVCGALWAVQQLLLNRPDTFASVEQAFEERAGSLACKEIRKLKRLPCRECVGVCAELLEEAL
jgi:hypothetical protein